jgi:RNA polymerase sigma factor (sigma-70 family)
LKPEEIIEGIRKNDRKVLLWIYRKCFPPVEQLVRTNGGRKEEARDVFQDALLIFQRKVKDESFNLTCNASSYIYGVSKNLWLRQKAEHGKLHFTGNFEDHIDPDSELFLESMHEVEQIKLMHYYFEELSKNCKELLMCYINGMTFKEMAVQMALKTTEHARTMFSRCKNNLVEMVSNDPQYKDMKNG